jgi:hypothetical protein
MSKKSVIINDKKIKESNFENLLINKGLIVSSDLNNITIKYIDSEGTVIVTLLGDGYSEEFTFFTEDTSWDKFYETEFDYIDLVKVFNNYLSEYGSEKVYQEYGVDEDGEDSENILYESLFFSGELEEHAYKTWIKEDDILIIKEEIN